MKNPNDRTSDLLASVHQAHLCCEQISAQIETIRVSLQGNVPDEQQQNLHFVQNEISDVITELKNPSLQVAFVGTTNAGKSTTVNGFIGRRLAPMENDEMSAGLLTITHAPHWSLQAERSTMVAQNMNTESTIYESLTQAMRQVIEARRAREASGRGELAVPQPIFRVTCPLLPANEFHQFHKTSGGKIKLIIHDLPGLRTTEDPENFQVIRSKIKRSLCIVVIDRNNLFEREKREKLLSELEDVVEALGGSPTLTMFLLNKIDSRTSEDRPISDQQKEASESIQHKLKLRQPPTVLPLSGLLLYRGNQLLQALLEKRSTDAQAMRRLVLHDCQAYLSSYLQETLSKEDWSRARKKLRQIEDDVDDDVESSLEDLTHLGAWLTKAAGSDPLWAAICQRLEHHGKEILVFPLVYERQRHLRALIRELRGYAQTQLLDNQQALNAAIEQLNKAEALVHQRLDEQRQELQAKIARLLELSREAGGLQVNLTARQSLLRELGIDEQKHPELFAIDETLTDLVRELTQSILDPLISSLKAQANSALLVSKLERINHPQLIEALRQSYEELRVKGYDNYSANGYATTNQAEFETLKRLRAPLFDLFLKTRALLTYRAERFLRLRGGKIARHVQDVTHTLAEKVWGDVHTLLNKEIHDSKISLPALSRSDIPRAEHPVLPEDVIKVERPYLEGTVKTSKQVKKVKEEKSCAKDVYEMVTETEEVPHIKIPSASDLHKNLTQGLTQGRDQFWTRFFAWFESQFQMAMTSLSKEFSAFTYTLRQGLEQRKEQLRQDAEQRQEYWFKLLAEIDALEKLSDQLAERSGVQSLDVFVL